MKKLILIVVTIGGSFNLFAQQKSCCMPNISTQNAMLASNDAFAKTHLNPLPFQLENQKGKMIEFACSDGKNAHAYLVVNNPKSKKYLFVFHEWWGLNDYIKKEADQFSVDLNDVNILAIDLYDGGIATTREDAQKLMVGMSQARSIAIVEGAFAYAGKKAKVGTLGWCMGGSWALQAAIIGGKRVKACVMYYGFPEQDLNQLKKIKCEILGIFAEKDQFINVETVKKFEENLKTVKKEIIVYNYVADHAFANPSNPQFNPEATKDAYSRVLPFLKEELKVKGK